VTSPDIVQLSASVVDLLTLPNSSDATHLPFPKVNEVTDCVENPGLLGLKDVPPSLVKTNLLPPPTMTTVPAFATIALIELPLNEMFADVQFIPFVEMYKCGSVPSPPAKKRLLLAEKADARIRRLLKFDVGWACQLTGFTT
jgi:hypothetical protein